MSTGIPPQTLASALILANYITDLTHVLTADRLTPYRPNGGDDLAMVTTYFWNIALCRELYPCLASLEVSMRNGIHYALTAHVGQPDWYDNIHLLRREQEKVAIAKTNIINANKQLLPSRVVAELDFGFWTSLLSAGYGAALWSPNSAALVQRAFPNIPATSQNRGYAHRRFNAIRILRNRVSHHEPIFRGVTLPWRQRVSLNDFYADTVDAIGWVSPTLQGTVVAFNRFPNVLQNGYTAIESDIKQHLAIQ